jgi:predicted nucleic acid-binding protein
MIVLDCNAAVAMVFETKEGEALRSLILAGEETISSELLRIELASALRKYVKAGTISEKTITSHYEKALALVDRFVDLEQNCTEAFTESLRLDHSPYDMLYFTLARRNGATLFTLDNKLVALCERERIDCIHGVNLLGAGAEKDEDLG